MNACEDKILKLPPRSTARLSEVEMTSERLFEGAKTLAIIHGDERYLLRITRQNKLILTK